MCSKLHLLGTYAHPIPAVATACYQLHPWPISVCGARWVPTARVVQQALSTNHIDSFSLERTSCSAITCYVSSMASIVIHSKVDEVLYVARLQPVELRVSMHCCLRQTQLAVRRKAPKRCHVLYKSDSNVWHDARPVHARVFSCITAPRHEESPAPAKCLPQRPQVPIMSQASSILDQPDGFDDLLRQCHAKVHDLHDLPIVGT